jgi:hypothetical protein
MFKILVDKLFREKNGRIVIVQWPNLPLWVWIATSILRLFLHSGARDIVGAIGTVALGVWAVLEIGWGQSLFRRLLGSAVLIGIVAKVWISLSR